MVGRIVATCTMLALCGAAANAKTGAEVAEPDPLPAFAQFDGSTIDVLDACSQMMRLHDPELDPADEDLIRGGYCVGWLKATGHYLKTIGSLEPERVGQVLGLACAPAGFTYSDAVASLRTLVDQQPDLLLAPAPFSLAEALRPTHDCERSSTRPEPRANAD